VQKRLVSITVSTGLNTACGMQGFSVHTGVRFLHSPMAATGINKEGMSLDVLAIHAAALSSGLAVL